MECRTDPLVAGQPSFADAVAVLLAEELVVVVEGLFEALM